MMPKPIEPSLKALFDEGYVQRRLTLSVFDRDYLHFADLAELIRRVSKEVKGLIFDYGSGGAPYAPLFSHCAGYVAGDLEAGPRVDRVLKPDGMTNELDNAFDFVLSTQVLEHVKNPHLYLRECYRILRPGGRILLSTHGMFVEHGCPHDYRRWTARGLEELFIETGFQINQSGKLTTQIRGMVQVMNMFAVYLQCPNRRFLNFVFLVVRKLYFKAFMPMLHKFADLFVEQTIVEASASDCIYVVVFVKAQKPS